MELEISDTEILESVALAFEVQDYPEDGIVKLQKSGMVSIMELHGFRLAGQLMITPVYISFIELNYGERKMRTTIMKEKTDEIKRFCQDLNEHDQPIEPVTRLVIANEKLARDRIWRIRDIVQCHLARFE